MLKSNQRSPCEYLEKRARNATHWANQARKYGTKLAATSSTGWVRATTLQHLHDLAQSKKYILEVGCGNGNLLGSFPSHHKTFGVDLTSEMVRLAQQHQKKIRGLAQSDACFLPFQDACFDFVYTSRCLINVVDPKMQRAAIREIFRIAKPSATVVLIENFEEAVARLNHAKTRWHAGPPEIDDHNLHLRLDETLDFTSELGWVPKVIRGYTIASFVDHILIGRFRRYRAGRLVARLFADPLMRILTRLDNLFIGRLALFGKDTMITLVRRSH
jgi:ubiquinone/menaquinone biosynthesis C-methylase UbiE